MFQAQLGIMDLTNALIYSVNRFGIVSSGTTK